MSRGAHLARATRPVGTVGLGALVGIALLSAVTSCAGAHTTAVTVPAASILTSDANGLAAAADTGNTAQVSLAAAKLRSDVGALEATGAVSSARASAVLAAVQRVVADATLLPGPLSSNPAPAGSPAPAASAVPTASVPGNGHGRKKDAPPPGHGKP